MKLIVYKGFKTDFLTSVNIEPLIKNDFNKKRDVLNFDKNYKKQLDMALISLQDDESAWTTYEEFSLIKNRVEDAVEEDGLELIILRNNLYPDYYPIEFEMSTELISEISSVLNGDPNIEPSEECQRFTLVYNAITNIEGALFCSFYNYEYDQTAAISIRDYYPVNLTIEDNHLNSDYTVFINDDVDTYLRDLNRIKKSNPGVIAVKSNESTTATRIENSLKAYCLLNGIKLTTFSEKLPKELTIEAELIEIAKNELKIRGFNSFRKIRFYKNPDINNEIIDLSQAQIIQEIIHQAENSYNAKKGNSFRDIFITASTGAGKSVMFQIPAVYLAKKYGKLTIIIEPVKALMQDQKEKLNKNGYFRVESFNSDLISQVEKEAVLKKIKDGKVDLLYLSPETLLSYSIETIIGDREIGLLIVDEAHIVTTWGVGFRPDYWYLGGYVNRLRNQIQTSKGIKRKTYHFPVCAFTATAINGGIDDSVSDTIISLYMENPVKYLGYVKRNDISFEIINKNEGKKLPKADYEAAKTQDLNSRIKQWLNNNEKTIAYFPYATLAGDASKGLRGFAGITVDKRIETYTGRNINELSTEAFNDYKRSIFDDFRKGIKPVMLATKAFGMGVDVDDVKNVYHYAVTGNLCDYVQEIGRAARKEAMQGKAILDNYYNDMSYINALFGMSQIRQYQIKQVLEGIYETYKSKKNARSFLISPGSFTYIFKGKNEDECINKLKTCLLMLEKDFYEKYNFKVIISRPQSIFTKAFICVFKDNEGTVLSSKYGKYMRFVEKGRNRELQQDGKTILSDLGDIYSIDLKSIWEKFYPNISFPQFKFWYFNSNSTSKEKVDIMPSIRNYISPRQKVSIEARKELLLSEIREHILDDFEYVANTLYTKKRNQYFTPEEFAKLIKDRFGIAQARIIANSIIDLVDPDGKCVKHRVNDSIGKNQYTITNGNFKELMRRSIIKSQIIHEISKTANCSSYSGYMRLVPDDSSSIALKVLSVFDYITYEVAGGEEPEIFIRLNDPNKIKSIVMGNTRYLNSYVTKAKDKHERDVAVLKKFFNDLKTDEERWNYIEEYFLGYDVLNGAEIVVDKSVKMNRAVDKEHSYQTTMFNSWDDLKSYFSEEDQVIIDRLAGLGISIPEYLETIIKKSDEGDDILMSWPSKDVLICQPDTSDRRIDYFTNKGWHAYRIYEIDFDKIKGELN